MKDFIKESIENHLREKAGDIANEIIKNANYDGLDKFLTAVCSYLNCIERDIMKVLTSKYGENITSIGLHIDHDRFEYSLTIYSTIEFLQGKYGNETFTGKSITELMENTYRHLDKLI